MIYKVKVYWPQDPDAISNWTFPSDRELLVWLAGVLSGPCMKVVIKRVFET